MSGGGILHEGEETVKRRAGVFAGRDWAGAWCRPTRDADFAGFLAAQPSVVAAGADPAGVVSGSILSGPPGFVAAVAEDRVLIRADLDENLPLAAVLAGPIALGTPGPPVFEHRT